MANNDTYAFAKSESVTPSGATAVSSGFTVAPQTTRLGLVVELAQSGGSALDGNYTVMVETADTNEAASGEWVENNQDSVTLNAVGNAPIQCTQPILDKVRIRVETDAVNPARGIVTARWLCDTALTALT